MGAPGQKRRADDRSKASGKFGCRFLGSRAATEAPAQPHRPGRHRNRDSVRKQSLSAEMRYGS